MQLFKSAIEQILKSHNQLENFYQNPEFHLKLEIPGFMPLSIERIGGRHASVMHFFIQNGDFMRDPDLEFQISGSCDSSSQWVPVTLQDTFGYHDCDSPSASRKVSQFSDFWGRNLLSQGFASRAVPLTES